MQKLPSHLLTAVLLLMLCAPLGAHSAEKQERVIPYPGGYITKVSGASAYGGKANHASSPYFAHPDFYTMQSKGSLTILPRFKTYQQSREYSCGPAAALMVAWHFGKTDDHELGIADSMKTHQDLNGNNSQTPGLANERGEWGTSTDRMLRYFDHIGWKTQSSLDKDKADKTPHFATQEAFTLWLLDNLRNNTPVLVEWLDWGGHWQVVIGHDSMGTLDVADDILIMADPYDTSDHLQDGYYVVNAQRFFYMWKDDAILPESQSSQQWIVAKPQ